MTFSNETTGDNPNSIRRRSTNVWTFPTVTSAQSESPPICVGNARLVVVPSPIWPASFSPQHQNVPVARSAQVWTVCSP